MSDQSTDLVVPNTETILKTRALYSIGNLQFVIPETIQKGYLKYSKDNEESYPNDALKLKIQSKGDSKEVVLSGRKHLINEPKTIKVGDLNFKLNFGAKSLKLPFSIKLNDFQLERYPGSNSPKSFASRLTVIDPNQSFDYRVYMNNVLDHKGYRFFQNSYDISGEVEETYLSVNHDQLGTWVTYIGYAILFLGLIMMLISGSTHFGKQRKKLRKRNHKNKAILSVFLLISVFAFSQEIEQSSIEAVKFTKNISVEHASQFSQLIVQDFGGRMKPINTYGSELLRKLSKKDNYNGLNSDQVILSMFAKPELWNDAPIIYIKKDNTKLRDLIGVNHDEKYVKLSDLFTVEGNYKLASEVAKAHKKEIKNKYEQSVLDVDNRASLLYVTLQGDLFKVLPLINDDNNTWVSVKEIDNGKFNDENLISLAYETNKYKSYLDTAIQSNDYALADSYLLKVEEFQTKYGKEVIPSKRKIKLELFYNANDIFKNLFWQYMLASLLLFTIAIIKIYSKSNRVINIISKVFIAVALLLFVYHTVGLGIRWYISGHAPWSNGYESMIYVAWATQFFGIVLGRKSTLTLAATTFVTSMILMVAHWNWMDPSIGNLVPVLDSYWLMIHVAIIVASYGPFTIAMILGMINLVLFGLITSKNKNKIKSIINELTIINELSITIGLVMLTIGNFLGGIWANESWGRYWGWDPKETWALISIMVYAFILHMRLVPGLRGKLVFNIMSTFGFTSILMTYLGVNHLLSGLHSYAAGESAPIPNEIIGWMLFSVLLTSIAIYKSRKTNSQ